MIYEGQGVEEVAKIASDKYGWKPPEKDKFFASEAWTNSDSVDLLKKAVTGRINDKDIVLTIPGYTTLFTEFGAHDIQVYDISVARLKNDSTNERHWADVSSSLIFDGLLKDVKPTALYLSNIPDHIRDVSTSKGVAENINGCSSLKTVFISKLFDSGGFEELTTELGKFGWKMDEYKGKGQTEKVATLQRN